ncbi:hypothetical protein [Streptomyces sp. NPDC001286]
MALNLPVQGAIDRQHQSYEPVWMAVGEFDDDGTKIVVKSEVSGAEAGPLPGDPGWLQSHDDRGWQCQPATGCVWRGLV